MNIPTLPRSRSLALAFVGAVALQALPSASAATRNADPSNLDSVVAQMQPGDTLVLAGGTYRDDINMPSRAWAANNPTTIRSATGQLAIIKGSNVVGGWTNEGGGLWSKAWTINSQQVFVNGNSLQQIGGHIFGGYPEQGCNLGGPGEFYNCDGGVANSPGEIWPGRIPQWNGGPQGGPEGGVGNMTVNNFYFNKTATQPGNKLYLKVPTSINLNAETVEVSVRGASFNADDMHGLVLRGIRFEHSNVSGTSRGSAVNIVGGNGVTVDNVHVRYADSVGLTVRGDNNIIRNCLLERNGQLGLTASGDTVLIEKNTVRNNNYRGFYKGWASGGMKLIGQATGTKGLKDSIVQDNVVVENNHTGPSPGEADDGRGDGIWCDFCAGSNIFRRNISAYNGSHGLHLEATDNNFVYDNLVYGNEERGIFVSGGDNNMVAHNLASHNNQYGNIAVQDRARVPPGANNEVRGNISAWFADAPIHNLMLPTTVGTNKSDENLFVEDAGFGFLRGPGIRYNTIGEWRNATNQDLGSWTESPVPIPAAVTTALNAKSTNVSWTSLYNLAAPHSVGVITKLGVTLPAGAAPGPINPPGDSAPAAPSGLTATAVSTSQINLSWDDVADETGYRLERKTGAGGTYAQIAAPSADVVTYNDTGLAAGTQYFYRLRASSGFGDSGYSNEANATTQSGQTTVSFTSVAAEDGWVLESAQNSNIGGSINAVANGAAALAVGDNPTNRQYKVIVSFSTGSLPDSATIVSATLKLKRGNQLGAVSGLGTLRADVQTGGFSGSATLQPGDFEAAAIAPQAATMSIPTANGQLSTGGLNAAGLSAINKTGATQLRLSFATTDNNNGANDYLGFYAGDDATPANRPVLEIVYQ